MTAKIANASYAAKSFKIHVHTVTHELKEKSNLKVACECISLLPPWQSDYIDLMFNII